VVSVSMLVEVKVIVCVLIDVSEFTLVDVKVVAAAV